MSAALYDTLFVSMSVLTLNCLLMNCKQVISVYMLINSRKNEPIRLQVFIDQSDFPLWNINKERCTRLAVVAQSGEGGIRSYKLHGSNHKFWFPFPEFAVVVDCEATIRDGKINESESMTKLSLSYSYQSKLSKTGQIM